MKGFEEISKGFEEISKGFDGLFKDFSRYTEPYMNYTFPRGRRSSTTDTKYSSHTYYDNKGLEIIVKVPGYNKSNIKIELIKVNSKPNHNDKLVITDKNNKGHLYTSVITYSSTLKLDEAKITITDGILKIFFPIKEKKEVVDDDVVELPIE